MMVEEKHLVKGIQSLPEFIDKIFKLSYGEVWRDAPHMLKWADIIQSNDRAVILSARKHLKSTLIYAYLMWRILRNTNKDLEVLYLSYKSDLAQYHTRNIKGLIQRNPYFTSLKDHKTMAESILSYSHDKEHKTLIEPDGVLSFKRGRHPDIVICDDILADPATELNISNILKITRVFKEDIMSLPKEGGKLFLVGTAQDPNDVFFELRGKAGFVWGEYKAIQSQKEKRVLWPEMFSYERLMQIKNEEIGEKAFAKEYMCSPVRSEEAFFKYAELQPCIEPGLKPITKLQTDNDVFGGWDLGKKRHPSHIAVFEQVGDVLVQRYGTFLDGMDYTNQIEIVNRLCEEMNIDKFYYDDTRGELEAQREQNTLHHALEPINLNPIKTRGALSTEFERRVKNRKIQLFDNERQTEQILVVDNNLQAIATPMGHGDSFWSIGMACLACVQTEQFAVLEGGEDIIF